MVNGESVLALALHSNGNLLLTRLMNNRELSSQATIKLHSTSSHALSPFEQNVEKVGSHRVVSITLLHHAA